ncbi:MAG: FAD-dependent oxidoreductase [Candidatus Kapaibacterium sp.]
MKNYDLAIIGGGISGLSAALILSAGIKDNESLKDKTIAIFDAGGSDALKAKFFNAPGVKQGASGKKAIKKLVEQVQSYGIAKFHDSRITEIVKGEDSFIIKTKKDKEYSATNLLLATGFRSWDIKGLELPIKPFTRTDNSSRVALEHTEYKVSDNIYVCGLLADVSSHYPIVAGTGAQAAINIMHDWTGEWIVIHDK